MSNFRQLTIIAPGLLGASAARATRVHGIADRIVVWARRPEIRLALREQPWCDVVTDTVGEAATDASLVVIAAPVDKIVPLISDIAPHLKPNAIVTDVGSVKGEICRLAPEALAGRAQFVGSHPMAGSEHTGWEHATPKLFEGRTCFITPTDKTDADAATTVARFWTELGSDVVTLEPDAHDEIVAHISHLPQVLASTLCSFLATKDPSWRNYAGGGLRDTTRIAGSNAKLWKTILEQNRDELLRALRAYQDELQEFQSALANRNYLEIVARLERAKAYRDRMRPPPAGA